MSRFRPRVTRSRAAALRVARPCVAVLLVASGAVACGGTDGTTDREVTRTTSRAAPTEPGGSSGSSSQGYRGRSKREAIAKAEAEGRVWRVVREDDERFPVTLDYVPDRLNFEIDDGRVTKVTLG